MKPGPVNVLKWKSNFKRGWLPLQRLKEMPLVSGFLTSTFLLLLSGCYYDVQQELVVQQGCDTINVAFEKDIVPILQANCYTCHGVDVNLGGVTVEGYENILAVVNDGRLYGAINHQSGFSPMPKDAPQLNECNLAKINKWISDGALNN